MTIMNIEHKNTNLDNSVIIDIPTNEDVKTSKNNKTYFPSKTFWLISGIAVIIEIARMGYFGNVRSIAVDFFQEKSIDKCLDLLSHLDHSNEIKKIIFCINQNVSSQLSEKWERCLKKIKKITSDNIESAYSCIEREEYVKKSKKPSQVLIAEINTFRVILDPIFKKMFECHQLIGMNEKFCQCFHDNIEHIVYFRKLIKENLEHTEGFVRFKEIPGDLDATHNKICRYR